MEYDKIYAAFPKEWEEVFSPEYMKGIKFNGETQMEVIVTVLRAFSRGGKNGFYALLEIYEILNGKPYEGEIDISICTKPEKLEKFMRHIIEILPKIESINPKHLRKILISV